MSKTPEYNTPEAQVDLVIKYRPMPEKGTNSFRVLNSMAADAVEFLLLDEGLPENGFAVDIGSPPQKEPEIPADSPTQAPCFNVTINMQDGSGQRTAVQQALGGIEQQASFTMQAVSLFLNLNPESMLPVKIHLRQ